MKLKGVQMSLTGDEVLEIRRSYIKTNSIQKTTEITGFCRTTVNKYVMDLSGQKKHSRYKIVEIEQLDMDDNVINIFKRYKDAEQSTGIARSAIAQCIMGITKTSGGYKWRLKQ